MTASPEAIDLIRSMARGSLGGPDYARLRELLTMANGRLSMLVLSAVVRGAFGLTVDCGCDTRYPCYCSGGAHVGTGQGFCECSCHRGEEGRP